jgi:hypothetical protein
MQTKLTPTREAHPYALKPYNRQPRQISSLQEFIWAWLRPPTKVDAALGDAIAWIAGAIAYRISTDWLISLAAHLWLPGILILITPAVLAVGLSTSYPKLSLVLGYRLVLVMMGLLIGGKL